MSFLYEKVRGGVLSFRLTLFRYAHASVMSYALWHLL
jgi:hypothetical protein